MKKTIVILLLIALIAAVSVGLGWTARQATAAAEPPLSKYVPSGALLCLQAKDFSSLLPTGTDRRRRRNGWGAATSRFFPGPGSFFA